MTNQHIVWKRISFWNPGVIVGLIARLCAASVLLFVLGSGCATSPSGNDSDSTGRRVFKPAPVYCRFCGAKSIPASMVLQRFSYQPRDAAGRFSKGMVEVTMRDYTCKRGHSFPLPEVVGRWSAPALAPIP